MQNGLFIAIFAGLGGMLGWGFADFFAKKTIDKLGDIETLFWGQLVGILPLLVLFSLHPSYPHLSSTNWAYLFALGIWSGLSYIPTYVAFSKGKVSLLSPIFATYAVVVAILSAIFFGEIIPFSRQLSFVVVFLGVLFINGDPRELWMYLIGKRKSDRSIVKGFPEIILAVLLYALWIIALVRFISGQDWVPLLLVIRIFSTLSLFVYAKIFRRKIKFPETDLWKYLFLIGFSDVAAFSFVSFGYSSTSYTSIVAMLSGAFSLPVIVLGRLVLKEKTSRLQLVGSLVVIVGVMLVSLT